MLLLRLLSIHLDSFRLLLTHTSLWWTLLQLYRSAMARIHHDEREPCGDLRGQGAAGWGVVLLQDVIHQAELAAFCDAQGGSAMHTLAQCLQRGST